MNEAAWLTQIWQHIWSDLPAATSPDITPILTAYQEPWRHYHTLQHLFECLQWWHNHAQHLPQTHLIAVALFYHDVVYHPRRSDNEMQSIVWMKTHLQDALPCQYQNTTAQLIADTQHHTATLGELSAWMLDIDLAILGAGAERFAQYEAQIRQEYAFVPLDVYTVKRRQIMQGFAQRTPLFQTECFRTLLEDKAKQQLSVL